MLRWSLLFAFLTLWTAAEASGADLTKGTHYPLGDTKIAFVPPEGFCMVEPEQHPIDQKMFALHTSMLQMTNKLIAVTVECSELEKTRKEGAMFFTYGMLMAPNQFRGGSPRKLPPMITRKVLADYVESNYASVDMMEVENQATEDIADVVRGIELGNLKYLGVLGKDDDAAYTGMLMRVVTDQKSFINTVVTAHTVIRGYSMNLHYYLPFEGKETVSTLLGLTRQSTQEMVEANH